MIHMSQLFLLNVYCLSDTGSLDRFRDNLLIKLTDWRKIWSLFCFLVNRLHILPGALDLLYLGVTIEEGGGANGPDDRC